METCYMCSSEASSKEHVPPKCFFPEKKDIPGKDFRRNLIRVPSCDQHNIEKSHDDEYLACALVCDIENNAIAYEHFSTKILRTFKKKPYFVKTVLANQQPVLVNGEETIAFKVNIKRFRNGMEMISRGLFFHNHKKKWLKPIYVFCPSLQKIEKNTINKNPLAVNLSWVANGFFSYHEKLGENPEIFYYQMEYIPENEQLILKLVFYGALEVFCVSDPQFKNRQTI